jgi:zinc finger HIT domain-containing protein 1
MQSPGASKSSAAVRKILTSQKTFQNHLEDYHAFKALAPTQSSFLTQTLPPPPTPVTPAIRAPSTPHLTSTGKRSHKKKPNPNDPVATPIRKPSAAVVMPPPPPPVLRRKVVLNDSEPGPKPHERDHEPLLRSCIPKLPTQEEVDQLVNASPLSYTEAKGGYIEGDGERPTPVRKFGEICGYWGRNKCGRCGVRYCGLECLKTHGEECFARYGA